MIHTPSGRGYGTAMVDVFVSYAREDAERVESLVDFLQRNGCKVWWDRDIAPGAAFEEQIEDALGNIPADAIVELSGEIDPAAFV
jgi:hypothetical protein